MFLLNYQELRILYTTVSVKLYIYCLQKLNCLEVISHFQKRIRQPSFAPSLLGLIMSPLHKHIINFMAVSLCSVTPHVHLNRSRQSLSDPFMKLIMSYSKFVVQYNLNLFPETIFIIEHFRGKNLQNRRMLLIPICASISCFCFPKTQNRRPEVWSASKY